MLHFVRLIPILFFYTKNNIIVHKHIPLRVNLIGELFPESISQAEKARLSDFHRKVETESYERFIIQS